MATFGIGEGVGILPEVPRTDSGYRQYSEETIARLVFARSAIRFGNARKIADHDSRPGSAGSAASQAAEAKPGWLNGL